MESPGTVIKSHPNKFSAACFLLQFPGVRSDANSPAYALSACLNHCLPTIAAGSLPGKSIFLSLPSIRETFCCGKCQLCGSDTNCITNNKQTQFFLETGYYVKCVGLTPIAFPIFFLETGYYVKCVGLTPINVPVLLEFVLS